MVTQIVLERVGLTLLDEDAVFVGFELCGILLDEGIEKPRHLCHALADDAHMLLHWLERRLAEQSCNRIGG
jgi:hypothetical protein